MSKTLNQEAGLTTCLFDYSIKGKLDVNLLEKSIEELLKRHESLRTVIQTSDSEPVQRVLEFTSFHLKIENLEYLTDEVKTTSAEKYSSENEMHIFDLETGPLFVCKLLKINETEWILLLNMHHSITDGWSVKILVDELGQIYTALKQQQPVHLPPLSITYSDFASWQNEWLKSDDCKKQLDFWVNELKGAPELLQLPMDFQRPHNQTYDGDEVNFIIDKNTTEQLQLFSQQHNGSLFVTLLSIFNALISRYTSQEEFVVGIPIAGRLYEEQESLVGMLINNFPLRITPLENMTFQEMYEMCWKKFFLAFDNQKLPIDRIVEETKGDKNSEHISAFPGDV